MAGQSQYQTAHCPGSFGLRLLSLTSLGGGVRVPRVYKLDLKAGGHAVEGFAVDAENLGRALAVVAGRVEDVEDVAALDFVEIGQPRKEFFQIVCRERRRFW